MSNGANWLSAEQAMAALGVTRATLYAYVSRGRIRSEPSPGKTRRRRYSNDDIERLLARRRERGSAEKAAEQALHWGLPILESSITLIADDRLYYRGHDATELARSAAVADVAALIWGGTLDGSGLAKVRTQARGVSADGDPGASGSSSARSTPALPFIPRAQSALARAAASDPLAYDLRPTGIVRTGWRIVDLLTDVAMPRTEARMPPTDAAMPRADAPTPRAGAGDTVDGRLADAWHVAGSTDLIRAALILCADHELNVSSFAARCVASAGASPYGVVIAGLAALEGFRHGGTTARIEAFWDAVVGARDPMRVLTDRLRRGEQTEGFGHPLYPGGDPRAQLLLGLLPANAVSRRALRFAACARELIGAHPTLDFALVAIARALDLPAGAPLTLFAIGRAIGWIGQAGEQYAEQAIIRPRARYVGTAPRAMAAGGDRARKGAPR